MFAWEAGVAPAPSPPVEDSDGRRGEVSPASPPSNGLLARVRTGRHAERRPLLEAWAREKLTKAIPEIATLDAAAVVPVDSFSVLMLAGAVEQELGIKIDATSLLVDGVSIASLVAGLLADLESETPESLPREPSALFQLVPMRVRPPLFLVPGMPGAAGYLLGLARALGSERAVFALQATSLDGRDAPLDTVDALAERYVAQLRSVQPSGPYVLGGHSFGGLVALEIARKLRAAGESIAHLAVIDSIRVEPLEAAPPWDDTLALTELLQTFARVGGLTDSRDDWNLGALDGLPPDERTARLSELLSRVGLAHAPELLGNVLRTYEGMFSAIVRYTPPERWDGPFTLYQARGGFPTDAIHPARRLRLTANDPALGWDRIASRLEVVAVDGDHYTMVTDRHVGSLAEALRAAVDRDDTEPRPLARIVRTRTPGHAGALSSPVSVTGGHRRHRGQVDLTDIYDPKQTPLPFPVLRRLEQKTAVEKLAGTWLVTGHAETIEGLRDRRLSSDARLVRPKELPGSGGKPSLMTHWVRNDTTTPLGRLANTFLALLEAPHHTRLRGLLAETFRPSTLQRWQVAMRRNVDGLLARACAAGDVDIMRDLAKPIPIHLMSEILGIPSSERMMVADWTEAIARAMDPIVEDGVFERATRVASEYMDYIRGHVTRQRLMPTDDLLGLMCRAELEGDRLSVDELVGSVVLLCVAGFETTTATMGNGILALLRNPEQLAILTAKPGLMGNAVEEVLRYDGAFRFIGRTAAEDVTLGGKTIPAGDPVYFMVPVANRDPAVFTEPDRFDITRADAKSQLALGHGRHFCLGAGLARLEIATLFERMLPLLPRTTPIDDALVWSKRVTLRGPEKFPVAIERAAAEAFLRSVS